MQRIVTIGSVRSMTQGRPKKSFSAALNLYVSRPLWVLLFCILSKDLYSAFALFLRRTGAYVSGTITTIAIRIAPAAALVIPKI